MGSDLWVMRNYCLSFYIITYFFFKNIAIDMLMQHSQQQHLARAAYFSSRQLDEKFFTCINVPIHIPYLYIENFFLNIMFFLFFNY